MIFYLLATSIELSLWATVKLTKGVVYLVWPSKSKEQELLESVNSLKQELADLKQDLDLDIVVLPEVTKTNFEMKEIGSKTDSN